MSDELQLGTLGQIARGVSDMDQAVEWYGSKLGLTLLYRFGDLAFFDCGGVRLFLEEHDHGGNTNSSVLYFRVDDIQAACQALKARGIEFLGEPHMIFKHQDGLEEWMAFFKDMDGQPLAVMSQVRS